MSMDLWVFNVGRGLCAAVRSPNGYLCVVDCGRSDDFSPIGWLAQQEWTSHKNYKLAKLVITHPHADHIADIETVTATLKPFMILRRKDLNWKKVTSGGSDQTAAMQHYIKHYMPPAYNEPIPDNQKPDWGGGFVLRAYRLNEATVAKISKTDSSYVNNSSFVLILKYMDYTFALNGDIECEGMCALLQQEPGLCTTIRSGVDFYLAPHHGHGSGFCSSWFHKAGPTKIFNIASERRKLPNEDDSRVKVDSRYSQEAYCKGADPEGRRLLATKSDGHIHVGIDHDGKWSWEGYR